jgi:aminoglycoside phosphotransferase (APT) family kinase protein
MGALAADKLEENSLQYPETIQRLVQIEISTADSRHLVEMPPTLQLRRLWPHAREHFNLEYGDATGQRIAGQWLKDQAQFWHLVKATTRASLVPTAQVLPLPALNVLLQLGGADRKLPGLAMLLARPAAQLIVHHPERRAVVRLREGDGVRYAKVVRLTRVAELAASMRTMRAQAGARFATPDVLEVQEEQGVILLSALAGASLYDLLGSDKMVAAAGGAGEALRTLHDLAPSIITPKYTAEAEIHVIQRWLERLSIVAPDLFPLADKRREAVFAGLTSGSSPAVLLHRDFYDKQVFFAPDQQMGLLDFDTLAAGEAALDIANALVHLELRVLQGMCTKAQAMAAAAAFCSSYRIDRVVHQRLQAYAAATRLRLACVYACRPTGLRVSLQMLASVSTPL